VRDFATNQLIYVPGPTPVSILDVPYEQSTGSTHGSTHKKDEEKQLTDAI
jgi:hypothetical protein